jgi:hypothetical protein
MHFTLSFENSSVPKNNENECKMNFGKYRKLGTQALFIPGTTNFLDEDGLLKTVRHHTFGEEMPTVIKIAPINNQQNENEYHVIDDPNDPDIRQFLEEEKNAEKRRQQQANAEKRRQEEANAEKRRQEEANAEKRRQQQVANAEKRRQQQVANAEKRRQQQVANAKLAVNNPIEFVQQKLNTMSVYNENPFEDIIQKCKESGVQIQFRENYNGKTAWGKVMEIYGQNLTSTFYIFAHSGAFTFDQSKFYDSEKKLLNNLANRTTFPVTIINPNNKSTIASITIVSNPKSTSSTMHYGGVNALNRRTPYEKRNVSDLRKLACSRHIKGVYSMTKADVIMALRNKK